MKDIWRKIQASFSNPKCVFWLGFVIAFAATLAETLRGRCENFHVYADATNLFWSGITPYTQDFIDAHSRYFLYSPVFNVLFTPFALLPWWIGTFAWNMMNYCLMFLAVWTLPGALRPHRLKIFLFLLSILEQSIFCYQYNVTICYLFLFAFTLLENKKPFWAVLLIMISATTKVYGVVELALLFCYPKTLRNFGYAALCGAALLLSPMLNIGMEHPLSLYEDMANMLTQHNNEVEYVGLLYARGLKSLLLPNAMMVQVGVLALLAVGFFACYRKWSSFTFRVQAVAILMGYIILLSDCPETHTYIISLAGYLMAYWLLPKREWYDKTLFWLLFVNFCILPTDVLCPPKVHTFIHDTFWLDVYAYTVCWMMIIYRGITGSPATMSEESPERLQTNSI